MNFWGLKSGHSLVGPLFKVSQSCILRCWPGWGEGFSSKLTQIVGRIHSFIIMGHRALAFCELLAGGCLQLLEGTPQLLAHGLLNMASYFFQSELKRVSLEHVF